MGEGPVLLLLHGFLESMGMWTAFLPSLSKSHTCISIDLPGFGGSDPLPREALMEDFAKAVFQVVDAEGIEKFSLLGHSMGGYIGLEILRLRPESIDRLILFHSSPFNDSKERANTRKKALRLIEKKPELYIQQAIQSMFKPEAKERFKKEILEMIQEAKRLSVQGIASGLHAMLNRENRLGELEKIDERGLIIYGTLDPIIDTQMIISFYLYTDLDIHLRPLYGVGHMGHIENPEEALKAICEGLAISA